MKVGAKDVSWDIDHGDMVTFVTRDGTLMRGRANGLLIFPTHLVLDMGGRYGKPQPVYPGEIVRVTTRYGVAKPSAAGDDERRHKVT